MLEPFAVISRPPRRNGAAVAGLSRKITRITARGGRLYQLSCLACAGGRGHWKDNDDR